LTFPLLLLDVEVLQGLLDLLAPRTLYAHRTPGRDLLRARDAGAPLLGFAFARQ
jgi:hypothetical protein